jgi:hypothetical protein
VGQLRVELPTLPQKIVSADKNIASTSAENSYL